MCEQAAEAHKSKGVIHSSRRSRISSDSGQTSKTSIDAILTNDSPLSYSQVCFTCFVLSVPLVSACFTSCFCANRECQYACYAERYSSF